MPTTTTALAVMAACTSRTMSAWWPATLSRMAGWMCCSSRMGRGMRELWSKIQRRGAARSGLRYPPDRGHHRRLQSEGRGRQDHHGAQPAGGDRAAGAATAGHRPRSAGAPVARVRRAAAARRRLDGQLLRPAAAARRTSRGSPAPGSSSARRTSTSPRSTRCWARASTSSPGCARRCARRTSLPGPVVIDTCPLLNVLSLNAVFAADVVVVPVSCDFLSLNGRARGGAGAERAGAGVQAATAAPLRADALRLAAADERGHRGADGGGVPAGRDLRDQDPRKREAGGEPVGRSSTSFATRRAARARTTTRRWSTNWWRRGSSIEAGRGPAGWAGVGGRAEEADGAGTRLGRGGSSARAYLNADA